MDYSEKRRTLWSSQAGRQIAGPFHHTDPRKIREEHVLGGDELFARLPETFRLTAACSLILLGVNLWNLGLGWGGTEIYTGGLLTSLRRCHEAGREWFGTCLPGEVIGKILPLNAIVIAREGPRVVRFKILSRRISNLITLMDSLFPIIGRFDGDTAFLGYGPLFHRAMTIGDNDAPHPNSRRLFSARMWSRWNGGDTDSRKGTQLFDGDQNSNDRWWRQDCDPKGRVNQICRSQPS